MAQTGMFSTLRESTLSRMRSDIVSLALRPGQVIRDNDLVDRYEVSSSPIREALWQLAMESLIEVLPNKRKRITPLDTKSVKSYFDVQRIMIQHSFEWGAPNVTSNDLAEMKVALAKMADANSNGSEGGGEYFRAFFDPVYRATGNLELQRLIVQRSPWFDRIDFLLDRENGDSLYKVSYASMILDAFESGRPQDAISKQRKLIDEYERRIFLIDFSQYAPTVW